MTRTAMLAVRLGLAAGTLSLAACGGGASPALAPVSSGGFGPVALGASAPVAYGAPLMTGATYVKRARLASVGVDVMVAMRDAAGLIAYARSANDRHSVLFRHWLSPSELADRFGAPQRDYDAVVTYLRANRIAVKTYRQRQIVRALGAQADVERALGMQLGVFTKKGQTFVAPIGAPRPPVALRIVALGNAVGYRLKSRRFLPLRVSNAFIEGFAPQQLANAFDYAGAYAAGFKGDGIAIGIIGTGPITDGDPRVAGGDVAEYRALFGLAGTGTVVQDVDTMNTSPGNTAGPSGDQYSAGLATPPPVTNPNTSACTAQGASLGNTASITDYTTCNPEDIEAQLDTEQAAALAPGAKVNFYIAYNPSECFGSCSAPGAPPPSQQLGIVLSDDETQQAISDDASDVISMSFGLDEADSQAQSPGYFQCTPPSTSNGCSPSAPAGESASNDFGPIEYASLASEGIAVFAASGDNGAEECTGGSGASDQDQPCVNYPATDPSVVSVGGVNTPLDDSGRLVGPITGWGLQTQTAGELAGGSGGGCSAYFSEPPYAASIASVTALCNGKRTQPDVALDADTNTGVAIVVDAAPALGGRVVEAVGGTSVATPEMAAMWALVLEACKQSAACSSHGSGATPYRLGNPATYFYDIYQNQTQYTATFYDVLFGNNALPNSSGNGNLDPGYVAGKGVDLVTGIGVPFGRSLIASVLADVP